MSGHSGPAGEPHYNYSTGVNAAPKHAASILLYALGLIRDEIMDWGFLSAVLRVRLLQDGNCSFTFPRQKEGTPFLGEVPPNGSEDSVGSLFVEELVPDTVIMPKERFEPKITNYTDKTLLHFNRMRHWWDNFEFEDLVTKMAGLRGSSEYTVLREKQADIDETDMASSLSRVENLPDYWKKLGERSSLHKPTWLLNGWTRPLGTPSDYDFCHADEWGRGNPFEWLYEFNLWLAARRRVVSGMSFLTPATLAPLNNAEGRDLFAFKKQPTCFVMLVSTAQAWLLRSHGSYWRHREEMFDLLGHKAEEAGCVCKVGDVLIASTPRIPSFVAGKRRFSRAIMFAARSMVIGYHFEELSHTWKSPGKDAQRIVRESPYLCRLGNDRDNAVHCEAKYCSAVLRENLEGETANHDVGRVAVDLLEP